MCAPPRFCTQLWALQRYFCLFVILSGLESTTLKPIYWFWASGASQKVFHDVERKLEMCEVCAAVANTVISRAENLAVMTCLSNS